MVCHAIIVYAERGLYDRAVPFASCKDIYVLSQKSCYMLYSSLCCCVMGLGLVSHHVMH
jgi:hypothetical protein